MLDLSNIGFASVNDTDITYTHSVDFLDTLENSVLVGLCTGLIVGQTQMVDSDIAYVRIVRSNFIGIANETLMMSCDDCGDTVVEVSSTVS